MALSACYNLEGAEGLVSKIYPWRSHTGPSQVERAPTKSSVVQLRN